MERRISALDIATIGMMVAILEVCKLQLSFIPNVELVSLLIILFTLAIGKKVFYAIAAFVLIEGVLYGFGIWWIMYLYSWPTLALITLLLRHNKSAWVYAIESGAFGLSYGALCSIPYFFIGGVRTAVTWWIAGIPYDIIHGISNFLICLILFPPLHRVINKLNSKIR